MVGAMHISSSFKISPDSYGFGKGLQSTVPRMPSIEGLITHQDILFEVI